MNTRKFYFLITCVISISLFATGIFILHSLNSYGNDENTHVSSFFENFSLKKDPVNLLLLVGDKSSGNTDTIMVINYNPTTAKINILSIPRDTKVRLRGTRTAKINSAYAAGGPELAVDTISSLLDVNINYYIHLNISTFRGIIDMLGGVEFDIPCDLKYDDPYQDLHINLKKGRQLLDGDKAEQLLRFRKPNGRISKEMLKYFDGSDLKREETQQKFIQELISQKANIFYITKLSDILAYVFKNIKTNLDINEALKMSGNLNKLSSYSLKSFRVSGTTENEIYYYYVFDDKIIDNTTNQTLPASEAIDKYFKASGGYISKSNPDYNPDTVKNTGTAKSNSGTVKRNNSSTKGTKKDFSKNNPSNTDSSLKGPTTPKP